MSYKGYLLSLRHYSRTKPVACSVVHGNFTSFFTVKMHEPYNQCSGIFKGDPITFGKMDGENEVSLFGGFVLTTDENNSSITVSPDLTSFAVERRKNFRYPVSIIAYIKHGTSNTSSAWIKDMSYEGVRLLSDAELAVEENIQINICVSNSVFDLEGMVVRKSVLYGRNEYGVLLSFRYKSSVFSTREYIDNYILQEKKIIENHLAMIDQQ